jgi:hypothetical protein
MDAGAKGKQKNGMGNPAIEKGEAGHKLPSVTTGTKRSKLFACAKLTPPPIGMDWSLILKDEI